MSEEKQLGFSIVISGISNEATEMQKLTIQLQNLNKEYKDLQKTIKEQGGFASNTQLQQLAAYSKEIDSHKDKIKELVKVVDSAPDSLNRMRAELIKLKDEYANASGAIREKMAPAILKLNNEISKNEEAIGTHQRNVGNYGSAFAGLGAKITSAIGPMALVTAAVGLATKLFEGMKEAVMSTTFAIDLMNKVGAVSKQLFYDMAINGKLNLDNLINASKIQGELNILRIKEAFDVLEISKVNREEQAVRERSIDRTRTHTERLVDLNKVKELEHTKTLLVVDDIEKEIAAKEKLYKQQPANEKLMLSILALRAKVNDTYAQEDAAMRRIETQRTTFMAEERQQRVEQLREIFQANQDEIDAEEEKYKKLAEARVKAAAEAEIAINENHKAITAFYKKKWEDIVNEEKKGNSLKHDIQKLFGISDRQMGLQHNKELEADARDTYKKFQETELKDFKLTEESKVAIQKAALQGAQQGANAAFASKRTRLQAEMTAELSNTNLTEAQKTEIKKKYARMQQKTDISQAVINTALAVGNALATTKPFFPLALIAAALAAVEGAIQIAAIKAQTFARGGYTGPGNKYEPAGIVHRGEWIAPKEMVDSPRTGPVISALERQRMSFGGSGIMNSPGPFGYATGGYARTPQVIPVGGFNTNEFREIVNEIRAMNNRIEVIQYTHKVKSSLRELEVINLPNKI